MNYGVIDVETTDIVDGEVPTTYFWGTYDGKKYRDFDTTKQMLKFFRQSKPRKWLHHTNFDIIQLLVDGTDGLSIQSSHNGKLIKSSYGDHQFLNSYSCYPVGLAPILEAFGRVKHPMPTARSKFNTEAAYHDYMKRTGMAMLRKRNYGDCVDGYDCCVALDDMFQRTIGVSPLQCGTIAGTSFKAAQIIAGKMPVDLRFLEAYRGGRVEIFKIGTFIANLWDICSSYPFAFTECNEIEELWKVRVDTKDYHGPLFDDASSELLMFPNGRFESWVYKSNWERYIEPFAVKTKIKVLKRYKIDCSWLVRVAELVHKLYTLKDSEDGAIKLVCKFGLNSLYGRIGLKGESEKVRITKFEPTGENIVCYNIGKIWLSFETINREPKSNFPMATWITDNGRSRLYAGMKQNETLYCDTDSLFTTNGKLHCSTGHKLGDWKEEKSGILETINVKDYVFDTTDSKGKRKVQMKRKGGASNTIWSVKRFAHGQAAALIIKDRLTAPRKRVFDANGDSIPVTVGK